MTILETPQTQTTNQGFTLVELLVTSLIASTVLALSLRLITDQRRQFLTDQHRSQNSQTLRIGMNLIGDAIRSAGDNLENDQELPVISVIDKDDPENDTDHDKLIVQRQSIKNTLRLCADLNNGETRLTVFKKPKDDGCSITSSPTPGGFDASVKVFRDYRSLADGNDTFDTTSVPSVGDCNEESVWAYIHDPGDSDDPSDPGPRGEFFKYAFETSDDEGNYLHRCDDDQWEYNYEPRSDFKKTPKIYLLEEQEFRLEDNPNGNDKGKVLELIENRQDDEEDILRITNNIQDLELEVITDTGSFTSFNPDIMTNEIPWSTVRKDFEHVSVRLQAKDVAEGGLLARKDSSGENQEIDILSKFFPRNASSFSSKEPE